MLAVAAAIGLLVALTASAAIARRRRSGGAPALAVRAPRRPAGVRHLAASVSELSDLDLHLPAAAAQRRRLGSLLGSSSGATR